MLSISMSLYWCYPYPWAHTDVIHISMSLYWCYPYIWAYTDVIHIYELMLMLSISSQSKPGCMARSPSAGAKPAVAGRECHHAPGLWGEGRGLPDGAWGFEQLLHVTNHWELYHHSHFTELIEKCCYWYIVTVNFCPPRIKKKKLEIHRAE